MPKSTSWAAGCLNLLFRNVAYANVGDVSGLQPSATAGSLFVGLNTGSPGVGGTQSTSEVTATGYARAAAARPGGWTLVSTTISNAAVLAFGPITAGGPVTVMHTSIGTASTGAGTLIYFGSLTASRTIENGDSAEYAIGELTVTES